MGSWCQGKMKMDMDLSPSLSMYIYIIAIYMLEIPYKWRYGSKINELMGDFSIVPLLISLGPRVYGQ